MAENLADNLDEWVVDQVRRIEGGVTNANFGTTLLLPDRVWDAMAASPTLIELRFSSVRRTSQRDTEIVAPKLARIRTLQSVFLRSCDLTTADALALAPALAQLPSLVYLRIDQNAIGLEGLRALLAALPNLQLLDLDNSTFPDDVAFALAEALPRMRSLQHLSIFGMLFSAEALRALCRGIAANTSLLNVLNSVQPGPGDPIARTLSASSRRRTLRAFLSGSLAQQSAATPSARFARLGGDNAQLVRTLDWLGL